MAQVTIHELQGLIDGNNYGMNISIGIRTGIHFVHTPEIRVGEGTTELSELRMHRSHLMIRIISSIWSSKRFITSSRE